MFKSFILIICSGLEYLIDSCSKSLERIGILFSDGRKFSFSRDYQNLRNEIANMAQSQGNDVGVTSCNFESFSDDVKLLIYSSLGPNVFVQVIHIYLSRKRGKL